MNFFQHQDQARKKTGLLLFLLGLSICSLIFITVFGISFYLYFIESNITSIHALNSQQRTFIDHVFHIINSPLALWIGITVLTVVIGGSGYKFLQLRRGGKTIAESLDGKLLIGGRDDPLENKVLNIVEEMAIASGNPVPEVYLLNDDSINAFAAGFNRRDAVIGITQGSLTYLSRDELQGVIAHEFSHIHNGDMRLNMRLIAILHGILLIGLIGQYIARSSGIGASRHSMRSTRGRNASLGFVLIAIGYGGTFFGNIMKSAVSRQREFLADASAVQFTRNPNGISGALKKIASHAQGSYLAASHVAEFSHMFFAQGLKQSFRSLTATHPPLDQRIKRIEPNWQGGHSHSEIGSTSHAVTNDTDHPEGALAFAHTAPSTTATKISTTTTDSEHLVGDMDKENLVAAHKFVEGLPVVLTTAAHEAFSARAIIYGLLLDQDEKWAEQQTQSLKQNAHPVSVKSLIELTPAIRTLSRGQKLPLLNMCIPALKRLSGPQYRLFKKNLGLLARADKKISVFEWCLYKITTKNIEAKPLRESLTVSQLVTEVQVLLWITSLVGKNTRPEEAYGKGMGYLGLKDTLDKANVSSIGKLDKALDRLERLQPLEKPKLLKALIEVIQWDNQVLAEEHEILRAIADCLNCPAPPFRLAVDSAQII